MRWHLPENACSMYISTLNEIAHDGQHVWGIKSKFFYLVWPNTGRGYSSTKATRETNFVVDVLKFLELGPGWYQILGSGPTSNEAGGNYSSKGFPAEKNVPSRAFKLNMRRRNHHHQPVACITDYYVRLTCTCPTCAAKSQCTWILRISSSCSV